MGMGCSVTLRLEKEIAQLSINFICALVQFGHVGFAIRIPVLPGVAPSSSVWLSDGLAVEPQQNHHTRRGDRREEEKYISFQ
jgi:hypothetical protein